MLLRPGGWWLIAAGPALAVVTTLALLALDYRPCSALRVSGSGWQVFWVNNDNYCFRPEAMLRRNWPCRTIDGKTYCFRSDGLDADTEAPAREPAPSATP